jgi:hypothetical protein
MVESVARWIEKSHLYLVQEADGHPLAEAIEFAKANARHAPVFYARGEPSDLYQNGFLISQDGTWREMALAEAVGIQWSALG